MKEGEPRTIPVNITYGSRDITERYLSNFAPTPFSLHEKEYPNIEAFWQGLYFPEGSSERDAISQMSGIAAKKIGLARDENIEGIIYQGQEIIIGSPEHHELMREAIRAKCEQNPSILYLLLQTGDRPITHILKDKDGKSIPDSKSIPGSIFSQIYMDLRDEFREKLEIE